MAINFPSSPVDGQIYNKHVYRNGAWHVVPTKTALPKNYILNPTMAVSQEIGETVTSANGVFVADQWNTQSAGLAFNGQRTTAVDGTRIQTGVTTGVAMTGGEYWSFCHTIEALRLYEFQYNTPNAKHAVLRFEVYGTVGGTFGFSLRNHAVWDRAFVAPFTIAANAWHTITIPIPGDTVGTTWPSGSVGCFSLGFAFACGSAYQGPAGWNAGNLLAPTGITNGAAVTNTTFYMRNVGLYLDPYRTGVAPPFVVPSYGQELRRCQRYWYKLFNLRGGSNGQTVAYRMSAPHPAPMRITPAGSIVGSPRVYDQSITAVITGLPTSWSNNLAAEFDVNNAGNLFSPYGRGLVQYYQDDNHYIAVNARM